MKEGESLRQKLKLQRITKGYTQQEIADKIGVSRSSYTNIELGAKNPSLKVAKNIKEVLEYHKDDIFFE